MMPRRYGRYNSRRLQIELIDHVLLNMGEELWDTGGRKRTRLKKVLESANVGNVSTKQRRRWIKTFIRYGLCPIDREKKMKKLRQKYGMNKSGAKVCNNADIRALKRIVDEEPHLYLDEIQDKLAALTGRVIHDSTIWRKLTRDLKYSLKVVLRRARQQNREERRLYIRARNELLKNPEMAVFLDETAKDKNAARRRRYWSPEGEQPMEFTVFEGETAIRYSMMAAADVKGFIESSIDLVRRENGSNDTNPERGTVDSERFEAWVEEYLVPNLGNFFNNEPRSVVILDNASIHHSEKVVELIESAGAYVLYTSPYSPELNPIEYMFKSYKDGLRRYSVNAPHWIAAHYAALRTVTPSIARSYFRHCGIAGCETTDDWISEFIKQAGMFDDDEDLRLLIHGDFDLNNV